jgi:hypothetical protein
MTAGTRYAPAIHTPDSWARSVAELALSHAGGFAGLAAGPVTVDVSLEVSPPADATTDDEIPFHVCLVFPGHHHLCIGVWGGSAATRQADSATAHTPDSWARTVAEVAVVTAGGALDAATGPVTVPAKLKVARVETPTDSDVIPPVLQVCMVVGDHHYCFGIFAN